MGFSMAILLPPEKREIMRHAFFEESERLNLVEIVNLDKIFFSFFGFFYSIFRNFKII